MLRRLGSSMGLRQIVFLQCGVLLEFFMVLAMSLHSESRLFASRLSPSPAFRRRSFSSCWSEDAEPAAPDSFRQSYPGIEAYRSIAQEKYPSSRSSTSSCPGFLASALVRSACNSVHPYSFQDQHEISLFLSILHPGLAPRLAAARWPRGQILVGT